MKIVVVDQKFIEINQVECRLAKNQCIKIKTIQKDMFTKNKVTCFVY